MWVNLTQDDLTLVKRALDQASLSKSFDWTACRDLKVSIERQEKEPGIVDEALDNRELDFNEEVA